MGPKETNIAPAALWLYDECAIRCEGYPLEGASPLGTSANWSEQVPVAHRELAVAILGKVGPDASANRTTARKAGTISLIAYWNETKPGFMAEFSKLVHRFAMPDKAQASRVRCHGSHGAVPQVTQYFTRASLIYMTV